MIDTHVVGFCGKAGCGKTTVSNIIKSSHPKHPNSFIEIFPLAGELKRIAKEEFGWTGEKNDKGRKLLQILGTECGRMYGGENFWINKWQKSVDRWRNDLIFVISGSNQDSGLLPVVLCDDVRFDNEAKYIKSIGGSIVNINGRSYDMGENNNHTSEKGISENLIDYHLINKCDMSTLRLGVLHLLTQLELDKNENST